MANKWIRREESNRQDLTNQTEKLDVCEDNEHKSNCEHNANTAQKRKMGCIYSGYRVTKGLIKLNL